ncbi:helix-turn-helix domain-containing protein [Corynebacterium striatum]|uniref:helix-turn-helix domain-containing protein n=1 Tax=Corynebacterium striatum TaxID=43770 RepID=UPI003ACBFBEB
MDNRAQIRVLCAQSMSIRKIAAQVGCAKKTVERALGGCQSVCVRGLIYKNAARHG